MAANWLSIIAIIVSSILLLTNAQRTCPRRTERVPAGARVCHVLCAAGGKPPINLCQTVPRPGLVISCPPGCCRTGNRCRRV
uniref:Uncharacterized protein n=1 Tax=Musca domestica TaxID=7370 RepID=A0A1I8NJP7_MUSDO